MSASHSRLARPGHGLSVLYVNPEPRDCAKFARTAAAAGYDVQVARSRANALNWSARDTFDIIVIEDSFVHGRRGATLFDLRSAHPRAGLVRACRGRPEKRVQTELGECEFRAAFSLGDGERELLEALERAGQESRVRSDFADAQGPRQLLLVEDDDAHAALVEAYLGMSGASTSPRCVHVRSLAEAVAKLSERRFDAIIADLGLADAAGIEVVERVQAVCNKTPIVVLSGMEDERLAVAAVEAGAQDFLIKSRVDEHILWRSLNYAEERKRSERKLSYLAHHDPLTGLANRVTFHAKIERARLRADELGASFAVMFIDLDRFKTINDTWGHEAGDELLVRAAERVLACARASDTIARMGGDEFAILLEAPLDTTLAREVGMRVRAAFSTPVKVADRELAVTTSVGIAVYPDAGRSSSALLEAADLAMYAVKAAGRDGMQVFSVEQRAEATARCELEQQIHYATRTQGFSLAFQPQFDMEARQVVGLEALLRWPMSKPSCGPSQFVPILEETGLIVEVGAWLLDHACQRLSQLRREGLPSLRMAVNVSARQLECPGFGMVVMAAIERHGLNPEDLELEITESFLIQEADRAFAMMAELRSGGIRLALDDFGTGYSSLSFLRKAPLDVLKIDRSFIRPLAEDKGARIVARSIIELGHCLGLDVLAEGVETREQLELLGEMGCKLVQGYLIARPEGDWGADTLARLGPAENASPRAA